MRTFTFRGTQEVVGSVSGWPPVFNDGHPLANYLVSQNLEHVLRPRKTGEPYLRWDKDIQQYLPIDPQKHSQIET